MIRICICVPTRNRPEALRECIHSVTLAIKDVDPTIETIVIVRDNSTDNGISAADALANSNRNIRLNVNQKSLPMSENWDQLAKDAIEEDSDYVLYLADRRLLTPTFRHAVEYLLQDNPDVLVFDHQAWWLSRNRLVKTREYNLNSVRSYQSIERIRDLRSVNFDNLTPRLYNCLVKRSVLLAFQSDFGSLVGGPFPDISFQFRLGFEPKTTCLITSLPVVACNARHANLTSSSSGVPNITSLDPIHCLKAESIFGLSDDFVFARCISHIKEMIYYPDDDLYASWFCGKSLMRMAFWELSCPMTLERFNSLSRNLDGILRDTDHPIVRRMNQTSRQYFQTALNSIEHKCEMGQRQPLDCDPLPLTDAAYNALSRIIFNS